MQKENEVFAMQLLTEAQINAAHATARRRVKRNWVALFAVILLTSCAAFVWGDDPAGVVNVLGVLVKVMACVVFVLFVFGGAHFENRYFHAPSSPWLPDEDCNDLATLCERHPGLVQYRDQVRAMGRPFSLEESAAMGEWARVRLAMHPQHHGAYERLYGRRAV